MSYVDADVRDLVKDCHLDYLDALRESGVINMFGAGEYLMKVFDLSKSDAHRILKYWMQNFKHK